MVYTQLNLACAHWCNFFSFFSPLFLFRVCGTHTWFDLVESFSVVVISFTLFSGCIFVMVSAWLDFCFNFSICATLINLSIVYVKSNQCTFTQNESLNTFVIAYDDLCGMILIHLPSQLLWFSFPFSSYLIILLLSKLDTDGMRDLSQR